MRHWLPWPENDEGQTSGRASSPGRGTWGTRTPCPSATCPRPPPRRRRRPPPRPSSRRARARASPRSRRDRVTEVTRSDAAGRGGGPRPRVWPPRWLPGWRPRSARPGRTPPSGSRTEEPAALRPRTRIGQILNPERAIIISRVALDIRAPGFDLSIASIRANLKL